MAEDRLNRVFPLEGPLHGEFDVTPAPRVLRMLGEINLDQWRCVAELCDNAVDGYLHLLSSGQVFEPLEVHVSLPVQDTQDARLTVRDTGPGMSIDDLENAVKAGWTGNDPVNNLGLFGMGFNIATARLGDKTTVWTTRNGDAWWVGVEIDFRDMARRGTYRRPRLFREKDDAAEHGTEVIVERLKPEQRQWFAKSSNRSTVKKLLSQAYSSMLRPDGDPVSFRLFLNTREVKARRPCIWGGPGNPVRTVKVANSALHGEVRSYIRLDFDLPDRPFCQGCWEWLGFEENTCRECGTADGVVLRPRRVHGWLGVQRYLHTSEYGIDFIRNGRKIEIGNKDLFKWPDENGSLEIEYPVDDIRLGGRLVGEIHLDHCRVNYTKDRFDRSDPAWQEMFTFVHGDTSLWPERAKAGGTNDAPLFKLFQGYRRAYRKNVRKDGGYTLSLAVPDNARAIEMSERFYDGDLEYQTDAKWYELSEEEDERLLRERQKTENATKTEGQASGPLPGFGEPGSAQPSGEVGTSGAATSEPGEQPSSKPEQSPIPIRRARKTLWREYLDDQTKIPWNVQAWEVGANDPGLGGSEHPWSVTKNNKGITEFLYNPDHEIFRSATLTPLDALLYALSYMAVDFHNSKRSVHITHDVVLAALREKYTKNSQLNPIMLAGEARQVLRDVARSLRRNIEEGDGQPLFMELSIADREATQKRMAARLGTDPQPAISDGSFLEYAPYPVLIRFLETHPEFFFDGGFWDTVYSGLEGAYSADIEEVQNAIVRRYSSKLTDAAWLADQDATDVETGSRDRLLRAWLAVELLKEGVVEDGY